ncbi:uncharacterized protein FIESC28_09673 [Fusarium coffeatum]|uniref:Uncharacterized protein n=1 Tax=Fusarium coffeatum TaxID=231269 RepID=A0A366QYF4_9HYPO|nr:uncharacterized protein FIESC28_09673 [Fusarium coffeatum]RBR09927.1 hypothetical protein FIESC28_09673 [Fusarium coffeatum]
MVQGDREHSSSSHPPRIHGLNVASECAPLEIVFEDPRLKKTPGEPSLKLPNQFTSLVEGLANGDSQKERRRQHGLDSVEKLRHKMARLRNIDLVRRPHQAPTLDCWEQLVVIAATVVDLHLGEEDTASLTINSLNGRELSHDTILRDRKAARQVVKLIDAMNLYWKHDLAFDLLVLLDTPLSILRQQSVHQFQGLERLLRGCTPSAELQYCLRLYIPFLVMLLRPVYSLFEVQDALNTSLLHESDYDAFLEVVALRYDPIKDTWMPK